MTLLIINDEKLHIGTATCDKCALKINTTYQCIKYDYITLYSFKYMEKTPFNLQTS